MSKELAHLNFVWIAKIEKYSKNNMTKKPRQFPGGAFEF